MKLIVRMEREIRTIEHVQSVEVVDEVGGRSLHVVVADEWDKITITEENDGN